MVDRRIPSDIEPKGWIGRTVGLGQSMVGLRLVHGLRCDFQVGTRVQRNFAEFLQRQDLVVEVEVSGDIELLNRRAVIQKHEQLDFRGAQIDLRGLQIGLVLHPLQFQSVEIDLRDVASLQTIAAHVQQVVVVGEVFPGHVEDCFRLQRVHESAAQIEEQVSFQVTLSGS